MTNAVAILSMLHEPPAETGPAGRGRCSAVRLFRGKPVLRWTLERLGRSQRLRSAAVLCWDDQADAVAAIAGGARLVSKGPRSAVPEIESVATARRWADGWRGGLLGTCDFDRGFYAPWYDEVAKEAGADAVLLVDPAAALTDPALIDELIARAADRPDLELCFAPAAPGLGGFLLRPALLGRLSAHKTHAGRMMHYHPDRVSRELLAADCCLPVPTPVARTVERFTLDSDRQVRRVTEALASLNGQLISSGAEEIVRRLAARAGADPLPREIVLELNTARASRPIFAPGHLLNIGRPEFSIDQARRLFAELAGADDVRLTLAGVGDPLLHPEVFTLIDAAKLEAGVAIHLETDLLGVSPEQIARLAASPVDVVSVHVPALSPTVYARVMGCDGYAAVLDNVRRFLADRQARRNGVPLLVPIFTKCRENLAEMEAWYDQWLRAAGSAVIRGPGDCAGQIPDTSVADMAPPGRRGCARLRDRLTILSDGTIVSCEQDVLGKQPMGRLNDDRLADAWRGRFEALRQDHLQGRWDAHPLCGRCRDWHRP